MASSICYEGSAAAMAARVSVLLSRSRYRELDCTDVGIGVDDQDTIGLVDVRYVGTAVPAANGAGCAAIPGAGVTTS
jgi:hypothetical protein